MSKINECQFNNVYLYKMMSTVIANHLKLVLDKIISNDQKGFISGRCIGENIRLIYDILFESKQQNIPGLLVSIDFQKTFDSLSMKFIDNTSIVVPPLKMDKTISERVRILYTTKWNHVRLFLFTERLQARGSIITIYFLFCVWKFRNNIEIRGIQLNETEFNVKEQNRTELY